LGGITFYTELFTLLETDTAGTDRPLPAEGKDGSSDLFCLGEGGHCAPCLERQRQALESLRSDGRKAKKTLAADRFRITEVPGGSER